jgi:hypothetical protein
MNKYMYSERGERAWSFLCPGKVRKNVYNH